jgi:hypothetical protein
VPQSEGAMSSLRAPRSAVSVSDTSNTSGAITLAVGAPAQPAGAQQHSSAKEVPGGLAAGPTGLPYGYAVHAGAGGTWASGSQPAPGGPLLHLGPAGAPYLHFGAGGGAGGLPALVPHSLPHQAMAHAFSAAGQGVAMPMAAHGGAGMVPAAGTAFDGNMSPMLHGGYTLDGDLFTEIDFGGFAMFAEGGGAESLMGGDYTMDGAVFRGAVGAQESGGQVRGSRRYVIGRLPPAQQAALVAHMAAAAARRGAAPVGPAGAGGPGSGVPADAAGMAAEPPAALPSGPAANAALGAAPAPARRFVVDAAQALRGAALQTHPHAGAQQEQYFFGNGMPRFRPYMPMPQPASMVMNGSATAHMMAAQRAQYMMALHAHVSQAQATQAHQAQHANAQGMQRAQGAQPPQVGPMSISAHILPPSA